MIVNMRSHDKRISTRLLGGKDADGTSANRGSLLSAQLGRQWSIITVSRALTSNACPYEVAQAHQSLHKNCWVLVDSIGDRRELGYATRRCEVSCVTHVQATSPRVHADYDNFVGAKVYFESSGRGGLCEPVNTAVKQDE